MERSGILFVRTRGDIATLTRSLSDEEYNVVGLYWEQHAGGVHAFIAVDLARGVLRLERDQGVDDVFVSANDLGPKSPYISTVEELLQHREVERVACWPFAEPDTDRVIKVACRWLSDLGPPRAFHEYIAHPRTLMDFLPRLRECGLTPDARYSFPGIVLRNVEAEIEGDCDLASLECACHERGSGRVCEAIRLLENGDLRVVQNSFRFACRGCGVLEELAQSIARGESNLGHDFTRRVLGWRCTGETVRGSLCYVRDRDREDLEASLRSVLESLSKGERPVISMDVLFRVAEAIGARVDAPRSGERKPTSVSATLCFGHSPAPVVTTQHVYHLPLMALQSDVAALNAAQLAQVAALLSQPAMLRDERVLHLRKLVDEEMRARSLSEI